MHTDPSLPPEPLPLTEASVQEIQLELIRRRRFNQFNGPRIVASLRAHRSLWNAVIFDQWGILRDDGLPFASLIKLRDLPRNTWNVDLLIFLCDTADQCHRLAELAEQENWHADDVQIYTDPAHRSSALGTSDPGYVVTMWWD